MQSAKSSVLLVLEDKVVSCCVLHYAFHGLMPPSSAFWFDGVGNSAWSNLLYHRQSTLTCQTLALHEAMLQC
jgi:hypothetical protein